jgi:monothiol glutaredoxin
MFNLTKTLTNLVVPTRQRLLIRLLSTTTTTNSGIKEQIDSMVKNKQIMVFMKGTPDQPRCGFSRAVCEIFKIHGVKFDTCNVLENEELRNGIKEYSDWPTIPQVFLNGEFIGGCDILIEMHQSGDLVDELKKIGIKSRLDEEGEDSNPKKE